MSSSEPRGTARVDNRKSRHDWRSRMAVRGGPLSHLLARVGWAVCAALGALMMIWLILGYAADDLDEAEDGAVIGLLIGFVPIGVVMGALLGLIPQTIARAWLRTPAPAERNAPPAHQVESHEGQQWTPLVGHNPRSRRDRTLAGRWARLFNECEQAVAGYHEIVSTVPEGPGRDSLIDVGRRLEAEHREARRLAELGQSLDPGGRAGLTPTAVRAEQRLTAAGNAFTAVREQAASIALELSTTSDFTAVQARLDVLASQAPQLRTLDTE